MDLPKSVDDPSLLQHEPLCSHITIMSMALNSGSRGEVEQIFTSFGMAMRQNAEAAAAAKQWARLVFEDASSDTNSFEVMDGGEALYKIFFEYQLRLYHKLHRDSSIDGSSREMPQEYQTRVFKMGMDAIKLKDCDSNTQHFTRGGGREGGNRGPGSQRFSRPRKLSGQKKVDCQVQHPGAESTGDIAICSKLGYGPRSTASSSVDDTLVIGARPSIPLAVAKPNKRSTFKKEKKRKASSQKPPIIAPSDGSEDDKEPFKVHVVNVASTMSHRSKRTAPNQPYDSLEVKNKVDNENSAYSPQTNKQRREDTGSSQPQSTLTSFRSDGIVSRSSMKGRCEAEFPLKDRKHDETRNFNFPTQLTRASFNSRTPRKIKSLSDFQIHATKLLRRASMSVLDGELGEGSIHDLRAKDLQESTIQGPPATCTPPTRENIHVESKARRKRPRLEFETGSVMSHEKLLSDSHEFLGPDIRLLRPPPKKLCDGRLVTDEDTAIHGVPCGASSLEYADQLLRDGASNALVMLGEGAGSDVPDWTQDSGHDVECDDISGDDQEEANDVGVTTVTSAPSTIVPKLPVPAPPCIWAQSRQEVCESFEYFRSYHSGVYSKDDIVKGYLLGAYAANRDVFHHDGKFIISHGGGKSESVLDSRRGPKRYQTDQDQEASDKSVRALLKTCKDRRPIVLLADDKYALFPYDLTSANYTYVVLGLYWISHAWAECQSARDGSGRIVRWKFAFQWCDGQGEPWWAPQEMAPDPPKPISNSSKDSSHPTNSGGDSSIQCENCQERSPRIYKQGWMCLNPRCNSFWSINGEDPTQLDYHEEFLSLLPRKFERLPNVTPPRVVGTPGGVTTTYAFSKGWHCTKCGRLSCRYKWEYWECSNCQFKHVVYGRLRSPKEFWHQRSPKGFLHSQIGKDSGILASCLEPINLGTHKGFVNRLTFILPHNRGNIHLILGTPLSNGDADGIFRLYQQQASTGELKLRRYPLRNHRARGLLLTNYFSQNSGEPYQYVGGSGHTVPFCEAPDCVRQALALIKERSGLALRTNIPFNEVLSAAYMERQKMSFHSDSERGLGPIVASLSLGSAALMHFRPHVSIDNPRSTYALSLVLRHGDVLVMEGDGVQKYYEHTVVPMNFRIAATARCIGSA